MTTLRSKLGFFVGLSILLVGTLLTAGASLMTGLQVSARNEDRLHAAIASLTRTFIEEVSNDQSTIDHFVSRREHARKFNTAALLGYNHEEVLDLSGALRELLHADRLFIYLKNPDQDLLTLRIVSKSGSKRGISVSSNNRVSALEPGYTLVYNGEKLIMSYVADYTSQFTDADYGLKNGQLIGRFAVDKKIGIRLDELDKDLGVYFNLYDRQGKNGIGQIAFPDLDLTHLPVTNSTTELKDLQNASYDSIITPLQVGGKIVGYASGSIPRAMTHNRIFEILRLLVLIGLVCTFLITMLFIPLINRMIVRPLTEVSHIFKSVSEGKSSLQTRIENIPRTDEIGELIESFNLMAERLYHSNQDLTSAKTQVEQMNRVLEKRVEERTKQLRNTQALLIQSSKMSALGEMAGGIAHEINTPLAIIKMMSEQVFDVVSEEPIDKGFVTNSLQTVASTVDRIAGIIRGLRIFSREGTSDPFQHTKVKSIIEDSLALCRERFKNHQIEFRMDPIPDDLIIQCRSTQIAQVLVNLLNNAKDALETIPKKWIQIRVRDDGDQVCVSVTDSGPRIPDAVAQKLFQPFFTTKPVGKGTGLGLSVSLGIIRSHHGQLELDLNCPTTSFVMHLPKQQLEHVTTIWSPI